MSNADPLVTPLIGRTQFTARAICLAERIELREIGARDRLAMRPLVYALEGGIIVIFRYGVAVTFDVEEHAANRWLAELGSSIVRRYARHETEEISIAIDPAAKEAFDVEGRLLLGDTSVERLQVVAIALSKTVALAQYENEVAENFDRIEPFADELQHHGGVGRNTRELLRHIGGTLLDEYKVVARVEVTDKPELTWDRPDLEQLYLRLADEFELRERDAALDRKLDLISRTAHTVLELLQNRRSLRVEWYIVALIVVEIALSVYDMFFRN